MKHLLKTHDVHWDAVESGEKTFEIRRDDIGFQKGDIVILRRMVEKPTGGWRDTGKEITRTISYLSPVGYWGIKPGYVVLGLKP